MDNNVHALPGTKIPTGEPDQRLINMLEKLLEMAKSGELRGVLGVGFTQARNIATFVLDGNDNVYETLGALEWLKAKYINDHEGVTKT